MFLVLNIKLGIHYVLITMYKKKYRYMSEYVYDKLVISSTYLDHKLRDNRKFAMDCCKTIKYHNTLSYNGLLVFNTLPVSIKERRAALLFKNTKIRKHCQELTDYQWHACYYFVV